MSLRFNADVRRSWLRRVNIVLSEANEMTALRRIYMRLLNTRFATKVIIGLLVFTFFCVQFDLISRLRDDNDKPYLQAEGILSMFGPKPPLLAEDKKYPKNYTSPWTWSCGQDGKCQRGLHGTGEVMSQEACWLTCGTYRTLWPQPKTWPKGGETALGYDTVQFSFEHLTLVHLTTVSETVRKLAEDAFHIFKENVEKVMPKGHVNNESVHGVVTVSLEIKTDQNYLTLVTDEHYDLTIKESASHTVSVTISGDTFFGVRHGLETLGQLIVFDDTVTALKILKEVRLHDGPAFPYRGLMIDTARNFMSIAALKRSVDGMAANKLNMLHLHLTDSNSFPMYCPSFPQMTDYGAYSKNEMYHPEEIKEFVQYARVRGVKVIPEVDAPAHAGNGWQWGTAENGYGQLAFCVNEEPYAEKCLQPPCGQLNPANPKVYEVLRSLYVDFMNAFDTDMFHMGGDEVNYKSWSSSEVTEFMSKHSISLPIMLRLYFQIRVRKTLKMASERSTSVHKDPVPIIWTSDLTAFLPKVTNHGMNPTDYVIQLWQGTPSTVPGMRDLINANYPVIVSNCDSMYLDWGGGSWLGSGDGTKYISWQTIYEFNFTANGYNTTKHVVNSRLGKIPQVLGAEAALWTEKVNEDNIDARLWPRGAALAERLWVNPDTEDVNLSLVHARLQHQNERMRKRGIRVAAVQPKSCFLVHGSCEPMPAAVVPAAPPTTAALPQAAVEFITPATTPAPTTLAALATPAPIPTTQTTPASPTLARA